MKKRIIVTVGLKVITLIGMTGVNAAALKQPELELELESSRTETVNIIDEGRTEIDPIFEKSVFERTGNVFEASRGPVFE